MMDLDRFLNALPPERFFGREREIERLEILISEAVTGRARAVAVEGAPGIGKSELMRQTLLHLRETGADVQPLVLDLNFCPALRELRVAAAARSGAPPAEPASSLRAELWTWILHSLVRQMLAHDRQISLLDAKIAAAPAAELARMAFDSGLGEWSPLIASGFSSPPTEPADLVVRGLMQARRSFVWAMPLLVIDGMSQLSAESPAVAIVGSLIGASLAENIPVVLESSAAVSLLWDDLSRREILDLSGLDSAAAGRLIDARLTDLDADVPPDVCEPLLDRLGGHPLLLGSWCERWADRSDRPISIRAAWDVYLNLLENSVPAARWRRSLEACIPARVRPQVLDSLARLPVAPAPPARIRPRDLSGRLPLSAAEAEALLADLTSEGFLRHAGGAWTLADPPVADWIYLQAGAAAEQADAGRGRAELMRRLLQHAEAASNASAPLPGDVSELLDRFRLQVVPQALMQYDLYFEALGELPAEERGREILRATRTLRLPEVIGVVPVIRSTQPLPRAGAPDYAAGPESMSICYAYAYRGGTCTRSHEETWIVGDARDTPTLTTGEIDRFAEAARRVEQRLGPGRYIRWLLAGEAISPQAAERLAHERIYCTGAEQLRLLSGFLDEPPANPRSSNPSRAAGPESAETRAAPRRTPVIPIARERRTEGSSRISRLVVGAQEENEVVAAMMAEKIGARLGFDAKACGQIKTAVLEGTLNAIEHSLNAEKDVRLTFVERPESFEIRIENEGRFFDPLSVADPDPQSKLGAKNKRGWGIKLMRQFMDDVRIEPTNAGMCLTLVKFRKPAGQAQSPVQKQQQQD